MDRFLTQLTNMAARWTESHCVRPGVKHMVRDCARVEVQNTADFDLVWPFHRKGALPPIHHLLRHRPIHPSDIHVLLHLSVQLHIHNLRWHFPHPCSSAEPQNTSTHTKGLFLEFKKKGYRNSSIKDKSRRWGSDLMSYLIQMTVHNGVNYTETCFGLKNVGKGQDSIHCIIQHFYLNVFLFQLAKPRGSIIACAWRGTMKPKVQNCDEAASVAAYWGVRLGGVWQHLS